MTRKITLSLALLGLTAFSAVAQKNARLVPLIDETVDAAPVNYNQKYNPGPNQVQSLFNVQFNYNATAATSGRTGMAGVAYTGSEFWVSRWGNDTIYTLSPLGVLTSTFKIPSVTGIRSLTFDGTFLYAGVNTTSIKIINPTTKTLTGTITSATTFNVRFITYDSTANAGAGGFWVGNFANDIVQISMTGAVLQTITAATHGLTGMYGAAIDHWTLGGPYLWVYDQGGAATSRIVRIQLPTGAGTGVIHETMPDIGVALTSGLAGGLFITNKLNTTRTIVGLIQGTPNNMLFGYELNDFVLPPVDARLDSLKPSSPYLMRPLTHYTTPLTWTGKVSNQGANTLTSTDFIVDVKDMATPVFTNTTTATNLAPTAVATQVTSAGLSASVKSTFNVTAYAEVNAPQTDLVNLNDTLKYSYMVTDTVFARELGVTNGALGIGGGTGGTLGQRFTTTVADEVRSITFHVNNPMLGDSARAQVYTFGTAPTAVIASTGWHKFTVPDTLGVTLTLPIIGGPFPIAAGNYFVGVQEVMENVTLATTTSNFNPGASWVIFGANPWATSESYGFPRTFFLRMNVSGPAVGIKSSHATNDGLSVYPNPASSTLAVNLGDLNASNATISIVNILGETVYSARTANTKILNLDLSAYTSGIYFVKFDNGASTRTTKFIIKK